jgi:hypothetical protein
VRAANVGGRRDRGNDPRLGRVRRSDPPEPRLASPSPRRPLQRGRASHEVRRLSLRLSGPTSPTPCVVLAAVLWAAADQRNGS